MWIINIVNHYASECIAFLDRRETQSVHHIPLNRSKQTNAQQGGDIAKAFQWLLTLKASHSLLTHNHRSYYEEPKNILHHKQCE